MSARSFSITGPRKRFGNVTIIKWDDDPNHRASIGVQLHDTIVVKHYEDVNRVVLKSNGWYTKTTMTCMNEALKQLGFKCRVFQCKGKWFVTTYSGFIEYKDGMVLDSDGIEYLECF